MRKLVWFTVPFAMAAAVFAYCPSVLVSVLLAAAALAACLLLSTRLSRKRQLAIAAAGLCLGFAFCMLYELLFLKPIRESSGQTQTVCATVNDYPEQTRYGCRVDVSAGVNGRQARTLLYLGADYRDLQPGDRLELTAELRRADEDRDGDTQLYYQGKGVALFAYARGDVTVRRAAHTPLWKLPAVLSHFIKERLQACMPQDAAGLVQALLTGDKSGMSYAQRSDLTMAGLSHTVAISGMHVTILLGFIALMTRKHRILTAAIGIPVVLLFVLMTGCSPSVIRAAVMHMIFLLGPLLLQETDTPTALCAAMLLLLLQNPYVISNTSFQLSFAAIAGMTLLTAPVYRKLTGHKRVQALLDAKNRKEKTLRGWLLRLAYALVRFVCASVSATVGALVFTIPITAFTFGSFSLYAILSNLLVLWAIPVCFCGGILVVLGSLIYAPLGAWLGGIAALPVRCVLWIARWVARLPFASVPTRGPYVLAWMAVYCAVLAPVLLSRRWKLPLTGLLGTLLLALLFTRLDAKPKEFRITALDVGQGQSVCMLTPDFAALYDCGGSNADAAGQHAAEFLLTAGVRRLDALVLSHYDEDHVGGVAQLLYRIGVDTIYLPDTGEGIEGRQRIEALAENYCVELCFVHEQTELPFSTGQLRILPPVIDAGDNAGSLSILFSSGDYDMLATGDMDVYTENLLMHQYLLPDVELFVAGHHGSKHSSGFALLSAAQPETVFVSVGQNSYGHPSGEALSRFAVAGAEVYRTDQNGDVTIGR